MSRRKFFAQSAAIVAVPLLPAESKPSVLYSYKIDRNPETCLLKRIYREGELIWDREREAKA